LKKQYELVLRQLSNVRATKISIYFALQQESENEIGSENENENENDMKI
jgi:hypothetical protein